jgi:[ribosomal protein S18]-alanine N-acetyltransferase
MGEEPRPPVGRMSGRTVISIRPARAGDLPSILAIERVSFTDPWSHGSFAALLEQPRVYFSVALDADTGALLGYTVAWFVLDEAELANLAVAPDARGNGIGAQLLEGALAASDARGSATMYLEVRASNVAAIALYTSHGFAEAGRRPSYYRRPVEDALILRRVASPQRDAYAEAQQK